MLQYAPEQADAVFSALGNATRRAIVVRLAAGEASVSELAAPFGISLPAVRQHLAVLERAGLVQHRKDGRVRRCRRQPAPLRVVDDWVRTTACSGTPGSTCSPTTSNEGAPMTDDPGRVEIVRVLDLVVGLQVDA